MVLAAMIRHYAPHQRNLKSEPKFRAMMVLVSIAADFDLIADWWFYLDTKSSNIAPQILLDVQLGFCILGIFTWLLLISDGRIILPFLKNCNIRGFSTGHLLFFGIITEDIPQVIITFLIDYKYGGAGFSSWAIINLMTSVYDALIKLAEAYDELDDMHDTGIRMNTYNGHKDQITHIAKLDNKTFLTASRDAVVKMWDVASGKCLESFVHDIKVTAVAVIPGKKSFLTGSCDNSIRLWNIAQPGDHSRTFYGHERTVTSLKMVNTSMFISGSEDKTAKLWHIKTGECMRSFRGHTESVTSICILGSNKFVTGSADGTAKLWNYSGSIMKSFKKNWCINTFIGHTMGVSSVANNNGVTFLTGSNDNTVKLWDTETGECLKTFFGHSACVTSVARLDTTTFISGSGDCTIKLWDMETGECLRNYNGHKKYVTTVVRRDENTFISGSGDRTAKLWAITTDISLKHIKKQDIEEG
mmetsp:Transcript_51379/g.61881  ORF Transcript_51379/g.61881 Transcript_51379/m.61881 type:complete len:472 (-) Transcript_51379:419-1834(-)|eukprot:CAMPEP_0194375758 /NCGR_PEP_ID=MMETSP0174-20130528/24323_1 /TAXON_ID=216777 /ORGANISM="Proboscia alata, Strain PI-D3" /LENGTH=471 /DNA_ID=CAMNT_0039156187 /DNA_START=222 /DNA_END=1637 /DNA_ORIENTATION=-